MDPPPVDSSVIKRPGGAVTAVAPLLCACWMTEPTQGLSLLPECRVRTLSLLSLGTDLISALFVSVSSGRVMLTTADLNLLGSNKTFDSAPSSVRSPRCQLGSVSACLCTAGGGGWTRPVTSPQNTELIMFNCLGFKQCTISHGEPDNFSPENRCRFTQSAVWDFHSVITENHQMSETFYQIKCSPLSEFT